jgi:hypothetical protein
MTNVVKFNSRTVITSQTTSIQELARASQIHYLRHLKKQREKALIEATRDLYSVYMEETEQESEVWKYASLE